MAALLTHSLPVSPIHTIFSPPNSFLPLAGAFLRRTPLPNQAAAFNLSFSHSLTFTNTPTYIHTYSHIVSLTLLFISCYLPASLLIRPKQWWSSFELSAAPSAKDDFLLWYKAANQSSDCRVHLAYGGQTALRRT